MLKSNSNVMLLAATLAGPCLGQASTPYPTSYCASELAAVQSSMPKATGALEASLKSAAGTNVMITDICSFASALPSSLQQPFSSHVSDILSWVSVSSSALDAFQIACNTGSPAEKSAITSAINQAGYATGEPVCSLAAFLSGGNGKSNGTITTSSATTPTSTPSSVPTAAAPRNTGVYIGAAGVAGMVGVVALL
ncbi:hypothetical protein F5Y16DRAFT_376461 [Xylariaceae sp. FL0255]|nr:hypothetical protein F5Y16DRAFT_376461 [Xylariaceae sp. FL0255]